MSDIFDGMFGQTLAGLKMKNLDTASLHEIIDEFAPLLTGDAVARPKQAAVDMDTDIGKEDYDPNLEDESGDCTNTMKDSPEAFRNEEDCSNNSGSPNEPDNFETNDSPKTRETDSFETNEADSFKTDDADSLKADEADSIMTDKADSFKTNDDGALDLSLYSSREESLVYSHPTSVIKGDKSVDHTVNHSSSSFQNHSIAHSRNSFQDFKPKLNQISTTKMHDNSVTETNETAQCTNGFLILPGTGTASTLDHLSILKNGLTKINHNLGLDNFLLTSNLNLKTDKTTALRDIPDASKSRLRGMGRYKIYQCEYCNTVFDTKYHLNRHMMSAHEGVNPFVCEVCSKPFAQKCDLTRHMNVHNSVKKHYCKVCGKSFKRADYLAKHEKEFCSVFRPHKCEKCGRCYANEEQLEEHVASHEIKLAFRCDKCDDSFQEESDLLEHKEQHRLDKPQECPKCHKKFPEFKDFVIHYKEHSGERPYRCALCNKVFTRNHNLMTHLWIHNKHKNHSCPHCGKTFTYYSNLQVHLRIHTGERPYVCGDCNKSFLTSSDLRRHHRTHSGDKPYICTCKMGFTRKERLIQHRAKENH